MAELIFIFPSNSVTEGLSEVIGVCLQTYFATISEKGRNGKGNVAITFNPGERWNGSREVVEFSAEYNGKRVLCAVSLEALCDNFGGDAKEPV